MVLKQCSWPGTRLRRRVEAPDSARADRRHPRRWSFCLKWGCSALLVFAACRFCDAQADLPDAPSPAPDVVADSGPAPEMPMALAAAQQTFPPLPTPRRGFTVPGLQPNYLPLPRHCNNQACTEAEPLRACCQETTGDFDDYLRQNALHIYTARELGRLAIRGVIDPFNLLTIGGTSALSVASDADSPFGPGVKGWARLSGVTLTQDMTGEFFGTFLIPSIDHQDPHYHRLPNASLQRRIAHCIYQVFWTEGDTGKSMVNYSTLVGIPADEAVGITYVPYQRTGWGASAERVASAWYTAPIGNFVTEFVPDVARRINLHVVLLQRIINQVALEEGAGTGPAAP
jgi:hypothetical protein